MSEATEVNLHMLNATVHTRDCFDTYDGVLVRQADGRYTLIAITPDDRRDHNPASLEVQDGDLVSVFVKDLPIKEYPIKGNPVHKEYIFKENRPIPFRFH